jgi:hypothetical protein
MAGGVLSSIHGGSTMNRSTLPSPTATSPVDHEHEHEHREHQVSIAEVPLSELLAVRTLGGPAGADGEGGVWLSSLGGRRMWSCARDDLWLTHFGGLVADGEGDPPTAFTGHIFDEMISLARTAPNAAVRIRTDFDPVANKLEVELENTFRSVRVRQSASDVAFYEPDVRDFGSFAEVRLSDLESIVALALDSTQHLSPLFTLEVDGSALSLTEEDLGIAVGPRFSISTNGEVDPQKATISLTELRSFLTTASASAVTDPMVGIGFAWPGAPLFLVSKEWDLFVHTCD